jgi:hypothetical protein
VRDWIGRIGLITVIFTMVFIAGQLIHNRAKAQEQAREVFLPVPQHEIWKLRSQNEYFLKKALYGAKNHRFITVDLDALLLEEPVQIELFDGNSITLIPSEVNFATSGVILWTGMIENPPITLEQFRLGKRHKETAEELYESMYGVGIGVGLAELDEDSGANIYIHGDRGPTSDNWFYIAEANFWGTEKQNHYMVQALDFGGPYHVLIEVEAAEIIRPGPFDEHSDPDVVRKHREYQEFVASLGPDPKLEAYRVREVKKTENRPN